MVKEAEDIALKDYKFSPAKINVNGTEVTDYTSAELDKIFLVNRKGILQAEKPSWIPELDVSDLRRNDFLPACVKDFSDGSYFVLNKSAAGKDTQGKEPYRTDIYKMPLDILTATIDYYLKKEREQLKQSGSSAKVSLPRSRKTMTAERFDEIVSLLPLCGCYKNEPDFTKKYRSRNRTQINRIFAEQYNPLLDEINGKKIDLNYSKQDFIDSYSKGEETSYGDSGTSSDIYEKHGVRIKKQNGTAFTKDELSSLDSTVSKVWRFYGGGTGLKNLAESYNLKISYADDCNQHARKAIGLFTPFYNAIGVSFFKGKDKEERANYTNPDITLAHETAHWLDNQKGKELHRFFASDKEGTLENKIASVYKKELKIRQKQLETKSRWDKSVEYAPLGDYWFRTCECLARAMEQRYALGLGISMGKEQGYLPDEIYKEKILPLADELLDENKKYFHLAEHSEEIERKQEDFKTKFERGDFDKFFSEYLATDKDIDSQKAVLLFKSRTEPLWSKLFADGEPEEIQSLRKEWQSRIQEAKNEASKHLEDWRKQAENAALEKLEALAAHLKKNDSGIYPRTAAEEADLNERTFKEEIIDRLAYAYFSKGNALDSSTIHTLDWSNVQINAVPYTHELTDAQISITENELRKRGVSLETPEQNSKSKQADKEKKMQESVSENINSEFDSRPEATEAELHEIIAFGGNNVTLKEYLNKSPTYKDLSALDAEIILKWAHNFNGTRENQFNVYILKDKSALVVSRPFSTWRKINSKDLMDIARNNVEEALATQKRTNKISKEELKEIHKLFPRSSVISDAYRKAFPPPPEPTLFDFAEEEQNQTTAGKDSHDQIEISFAEKASWKNENGEKVYVFLEKEKFDKGYKGIEVGLAKNFDEKNNTYNNSDHSYHGIAVVRDDGTVREQDSLPLLHAVAHPDDENIRLLSSDEHREFDVIMRNINPEYKKAYEDKLEQEKRDRESNAGKNAANYVLDRLKAAGIKAVTNKEEFSRILEREKPMQTISLASDRKNVYGFAYNGKIYLNPDFLTSSVAVHEYTHLWDEYTRRTNPKLWQKGMNILKDTKLFAEVKSDPNYADIADDDNLVLSEVHARICGKLAQKYLERIAKEDGEIKSISVSEWNKEVAEYVEKELFPDRKIFHQRYNTRRIKENELDGDATERFLATPMADLAKGLSVKSRDFETRFRNGDFTEAFNRLSDINWKTNIYKTMPKEEQKKEYEKLWNELFPDGEPKEIQENRSEWQQKIKQYEDELKLPETLEKSKAQAKKMPAETIKKALEKYNKNESGLYPKTAEEATERNEAEFKDDIVNALGKLHSSYDHWLSWDSVGVHVGAEPVSNIATDMRISILENELKERGILKEKEKNMEKESTESSGKGETKAANGKAMKYWDFCDYVADGIRDLREKGGKEITYLRDSHGYIDHYSSLNKKVVGGPFFKRGIMYDFTDDGEDGREQAMNSDAWLDHFFKGELLSVSGMTPKEVINSVRNGLADKGWLSEEYLLERGGIRGFDAMLAIKLQHSGIGSEGWLADEETVKSLENKIAGTIKAGNEKRAQEFSGKVSTYTRAWDEDARRTDNARWRNGMNIMKKIVPVEGGIDENIGKLTEGHASLCAKIMNSFRERLAEEGKAWSDLDIDKEVYKYINENFKGTRTLPDERKHETTGFGVFGPVEINAVRSWFSSPIKDIIKGREISLEQNTFTQEQAEEKEIKNLSAAGKLEQQGQTEKALEQQNDLKDKQNAAADISIQIRKDGKHFLNELYKEIEQNPIVFPFLTDGEIDTDSTDKNFELAMAKTLDHVTKNSENPQKMKENIGKYLSLEIKEKTKIKESLEKTLLQMKGKKIERKQKRSRALERG